MIRTTLLIISIFAGAILCGTLLLLLPISTVSGSIPVEDAFFTATSAICVTGLITVDTATYFTLFGKIVILVLFQLGGLGVITFSGLVIFFSHRRMGILQREMMQIGGVSQGLKYDAKDIIRPIFKFVFIAEGFGAVLLFIGFLRYFSIEKAAFHAVFHSVSAFCNAGFSTFTTSLMAYSSDWWISSVVILLIITGGLGFVVVMDVVDRVKTGRRNMLHTKLVLWTTVLLLIIGGVTFFILEQDTALQGKDFHEQILCSLFHTTTARTAGFNTVDYFSLSHGTLVLTMILMVIGGSPGSTAGGVKTTTAAILFLTVVARMRGKPDAEFGNKSIAQRSVINAITLLILSVAFIVFIVLLLQITELGSVSHVEVEGSLMMLGFETVSAFGTVGLSMGATSSLSILGKLIICVTMFIGRLGPLSFYSLLGSSARKHDYRLPSERVMVG
jgi:trk system potassium uptake protein TrkH